MEAEKATYEIARMARLLGVSRSGFYDWQARQAGGPSPRQQRHAALLDKIKRFHVASDEVYGLLADLREAGEQVSRKTVAKLMRRHGIVGISPRGWVPPTTIVDPAAASLPDLVERRFDQGQLNQVWTSGHHLPDHRPGLAVLVCGPRRLLPPGPRLGDHRSSARQSGRSGVDHRVRARWPTPRTGDLPRRQGMSIHLGSDRRPVSRSRSAAVGGTDRGLLGLPARKRSSPAWNGKSCPATTSRTLDKPRLS